MADKVGAIIVAAGSSSRMGEDKIFMNLSGKPVLAWPVNVCQTSDLINKIVIVLNKNNIELGRDLAADQNWTKVADVVEGGERRQDSVKIGLRLLNDCNWILIHDGARPFLTEDMIRKGLQVALETGSAIAAVPATDTIKLSLDNQMVQATINRKFIWSAQTPQVFRSDIIFEAYNKITEDVTDDAEMVERLGKQVKLFMGSYQNIKLTNKSDMIVAEELCRMLDS
jgi:2-C-methyl-D-erythritol 4-phosphate cytidylyltransferase